MFVKSAFAALAMSAAVMAKELPKDEVKAAEFYDNGLIHEQNMANKLLHWAKQEAEGLFESQQYMGLEYTQCKNGVAAAIPGDSKNTFKCKNMDLHHFLSHAELGSRTAQGSGSWGWTSSTGREFVAIGQGDGTAFAEIVQGKMVYLGRLPQFSSTSQWREIRGWRDYMIIGSEASGHGIQIFDMKKLLTVNPSSPKTFSNSADLAGHFSDLPTGRSHNVVTNPDNNFIYAVGAMPRDDTCRAGIIFIDVSDVSKPTRRGCAAADGYVHDAQCLIYKGPDTKYNGREICYGYNEDTLTIYDVTNKASPTIISRTSYTGAQYTHQGWVLDKEWQDYLILDDELDEQRASGPAAQGFPITYIWDIKNLAAPKQTGFYRGGAKSTDHNQYIVNGLSYQSNYGAGFRVLDVSSIPSDPTGAGVHEIAYFDIYPEDDTSTGGGSVQFNGSWSSYAYFKSGYILINTITRGAFIVKMTGGLKARHEHKY